MTLVEGLRNLFKPQQVKDEEKLREFENAYREEGRIINNYLQGRITYEERQHRLNQIAPITHIGLGRAGQKLHP